MRISNHLSRTIKLLAAGILAAVVFLLFFIPVHAQAELQKIDLVTFIERVRNGDAGTLRGIYAPDLFSFPVVQQLEGKSDFVSKQPYEVTQFYMAQRLGNIGLLAHNTLAGRLFYNVRPGSQIILVYGDGRTETFVTEQVLSYQTLPYGQYKNVQTGEVIGTGSMFEMVYGGEYHLTLQTCIENEDDPYWGRLFIIAKPVKDISETDSTFAE